MRGRIGIGLVVATLLALAMPGTASAVDFAVNSQSDTPADSGCTPADCTLREAVLATTSTADRVILPAGHYLLASELVLGNDVIVGAGARTTTIDAGNTRVATISPGQAQASLSGVTVTGGNGAGQTLPGAGGAFHVVASAVLFLTDVTVTGNTASAGGAIYSRGHVALLRTTIRNNQANPAAAAGAGGGIYQLGVDPIGVLQIVSSTIAGNSTNGSGGGVYSNGPLTLQRSTIAANTGGGALFKAAQTAAINDSIITAPSGAACGGDAAAIASFTGDHNLADDATCGFTGAGDKQNADPLLGALQNNGGQTDTLALAAASPAIGGANPANCSGTDQRGVARPQQGTCDIGAFEYLPPTQQQPQEQQLPPPVAGRSVNALPKSGTVRIKLPGKRFRVLREGEQIPVGTTVDVTKGRITLVAAADKQGGTATADFYGGVFKLSQTKGAKPITTLTLVEKLSCGKAKNASTAAKKKKKRRLWGDGKGRFRTKGSYSSATVRGTKWLVEDRCTSTLSRVVRGRVAVRDFVKRKTIILRAGKRYVANAD